MVKRKTSTGTNLGFREKLARLTKELAEQFKTSAELEQEIRKNLTGLGYGF
jgi:type I restriction enzyme M protein